MTTIVDQAEWLQARSELLAAEKELTRAADALARKRRSLPQMQIAAGYEFDTTTGRRSLVDLFDGRSQLAVYHFMFGTEWDEGCPSCSFWADSFDGISAHLGARDTTFLCSSSAPLEKLQSYRDRMGWSFEWVSSQPSEFSADMGFSPNQHRPAPLAPTEGEDPGLSVFQLAGDEVHLTYRTTARGLEPFNAAYNILDMTPKGRDEGDLSFTMAWIRRNDSYDD